MSLSDMLNDYRSQAERMKLAVEQARRGHYRSKADRDRQIGHYLAMLDNLDYSIQHMEKSESQNVRFIHVSPLRLDGKRGGGHR